MDLIEPQSREDPEVAQWPALKTLMFYHQGLTLKNEHMTLFRTLRINDQRLTVAYRLIWSPDQFEVNL